MQASAVSGDVGGVLADGRLPPLQVGSLVRSRSRMYDSSVSFFSAVGAEVRCSVFACLGGMRLEVDRQWVVRSSSQLLSCPREHRWLLKEESCAGFDFPSLSPLRPPVPEEVGVVFRRTAESSINQCGLTNAWRAPSWRFTRTRARDLRPKDERETRPPLRRLSQNRCPPRVPLRVPSPVPFSRRHRQK